MAAESADPARHARSRRASTIEGWPFLTQVVAGSIGTVRVGADDIGTTNDAPLAIARTDLVLTDVTSTDRFATMDVARPRARRGSTTPPCRAWPACR